MNFIFMFHKCFSVKEKVTIISRQSDEPSMDILFIKRRMEEEHPDVEVKILCKKIKSGLIPKIPYGFHMIGTQMHSIATSKVVLLDGYCIAVSVLKQKRNLTVIQMWHAMGCLKKFGKSAIGYKEGSSEKLAEMMNMHKGYSVFFASSAESISFFADAFGYDVQKGIVMPLPRTDYLKSKEYQNEQRDIILSKRIEYKDKTNILYAPTFRKDNISNKKIKELIDNIDEKKYNLIISPHPVMDISEFENNVEREFSSIELLSVCDIVISDYSAFIFEAATAKKPTYLYVYDYETYYDKRGFYISFDQDVTMPKYTNATELVYAIEKEKYDYDALEAFSNRFIKNTDDATGSIVEFIYECLFK